MYVKIDSTIGLVVPFVDAASVAITDDITRPRSVLLVRDTNMADGFLSGTIEVMRGVPEYASTLGYAVFFYSGKQNSRKCACSG